MTNLSGWGRNHWSDCELLEPECASDVFKTLDVEGTITRGLARSYGDPATNANHRVIGTTRLNRYLSFDETTGTLTCEAGVTLEQILETFAPRGWFPSITPGTKYVTVGGCIANDVHGKAHHEQGSFNTCVQAMRVLLADGRVVNASRTENSDLFWASFGGMGLLGVILDATISLRRITSTYFHKEWIACDSLEALIDALDENNSKTPYAVANLNPSATGARLGEGVLTIGDHASADELPEKLKGHPLKLGRPPFVTVPFELPSFTLNPMTLTVLNQIIMKMLKSRDKVVHYEDFFYPLDMFHEWNRGYGPRGFTQYQFVIPLEDGRRRMRELLEAIVSSGLLPFLNVLKRLGKESQGHLAFPTEGYTLAIDFPIRDGTADLAHRLDRMVIDAGGRVYLGKDSFLTASSMRAMYPRLDEWLAIKAKYDPNGVFASDLARRVGLVR